MSRRVIQWATGNIGQASLRQILRHPELELVGLLVYSHAKEGVDAGTLIGEPTCGVTATTDRERIFGLEADVVVHTPLNARGNIVEHDRDVIRLLKSGKNVVSTASYVWPAAHGSDYAQQFIDAATQGGSTLLGSGLNPGFLFERLGPMTTAVCSAIDRIRFAETFDVGKDPSAAKVFEQLGMGLTEDEYRQRTEIRETFDAYFAEVLHAVAAALGLAVTDVLIDLEVGAATRDLDLPAGHIVKGRVAGTRWTLTGQTGDGPVLVLEETWAVDRQIPGWDIRNHWLIEIEGEPSLRTEFTITRTWGDRNSKPRYDPFSHAIAAVAVNAIPALCDAPPGIAHPVSCGGMWMPTPRTEPS
jgi:2,4-diaminopentanoate dehydrogenase